MVDIDFYGLKLTEVDKEKLYVNICKTIEVNEKCVIYGYSLGAIRLMRKFPVMYSFGSGVANINLVDGRGLFLLGKLFGFPFKDDISIPEFSKKILSIANENSYSVLLFGASEKSNSNATSNVRSLYSNIKVYDGINGYFNIDEEKKIVEKINYYKPDVLYVGISTPIKEEFIIRWKDYLDVKVIVLCGGVIDILSGEKKQTPKLLKKMGVASLYRFIQEPVRLSRYFFPFIIFMLFNFLPVLVFKVLILRDKNFSIPNHYNLKR